MKRISLQLITVTACLIFASAGFAQSSKSRVRESMIVSTDWLAKHLNDDSLVLLQVGEKKEYDEAHIPGAQFIQLQDISTPRGQGLILELPSVDQLKTAFEKLGVTDKSRIIVYFGKDMGHAHGECSDSDYGSGAIARQSDGGLPAWRARIAR